jgi:hypothetical protein
MRNPKALGLSIVIALSTVVAALPSEVAASPLGWSEPVRISPGDDIFYDVGAVSSAISLDGRALAAWDDYDPVSGYQEVFYRWYTIGQGWGETQVLFDYYGANLDSPSVAVSHNGDFMLVAVDHGGFGGPYVIAYRYNASAAFWESVGAPNAPFPTDLSKPAVAMDGDGNALAVWLENDGTSTNVTANHYTAGTGWDGEVTLDDQPALPENPHLVMDGAGNAVVTWVQSDGTYTNLYASGHSVGGGWSTPFEVDGQDTSAFSSALAMDSLGNAMAGWVQSNGSYGNVYLREWRPFAGWQATVDLSGPLDRGVGIVRVAGGAGGQFVATWNQYNGDEYQEMASIFASSTWATPTNLSAAFVGGGGQTGYVGYDAYGNAAVVWAQYGGGHALQAYVVWGRSGSAWGAAQRLDGAPGIDANLRGLTVNPVGWALAFWEQSDGYKEYAWATFYAPPDVTPPPLTLSLPLDGTHVENASVWVDGYSVSGVTRVSVNGLAASVDEFGEFSLLVPLGPGNNTIYVQAFDPSGNEADAAVTVVYDDPSVQLAADLAATQAQLGGAQGALATTQTNLASTQAQLAAAQADLLRLQNNQTALQGQLTTAQSENGNQTARITELQASSGGAGTLLGVLGIVIGLAAIAMAVLMNRRRPASPPAPKDEPKPAEPPK